jgi:glutamyl-Q tRNA(Asp) synthetase
MVTRPVFRFAPSPNGALHLGHAYSALLNRHLAERVGGRLLLRLEDIDTTRCTPEFEAGIFRDLEWLGVRWEESVRRQSEYFATYAESLRRLERQGLVYPAFMSRGEMRAHIVEREARGENWPRDPDGVPLYPGLDKALSRRKREALIAEGRPFAWRLDMVAALGRVGGSLAWEEISTGETGQCQTLDAPLSDTPTPNPSPQGGGGHPRVDADQDRRPSVTGEAGAKSPSPLRGGVRGGGTRIDADPAAWGDVVLARRDVPTSYHLSVVVDDALQGVTHVVRGLDLYAATAVHRLLQRLLGLPAPAYHHHRLILGPDGRKLSKSFGDTGIAALREAGETPETVRRMVGFEAATNRAP